MNKFKNKKGKTGKSSIIKLIILTTSLLSSLTVFANDLDDILPPGDGGNPNNAPIDTPYFWVLLFIIGVFIAFIKFKPKFTTL